MISNGFGGSVATYPASATGSATSTRAFTPTGDNIQSIAVGSAMIAVTTPGTGVALYALDATGWTARRRRSQPARCSRCSIPAACSSIARCRPS